MQLHQNWKNELQIILDQNLKIRQNGNIASHKTQSDRANYLFSFFKLLRELGYAVMPRNLKQKHIQVAFDFYTSDKAKDGQKKKSLSASTIQNYLMHLRAFARWIGKDGMIGRAEQYISDKTKYQRSYQAAEDKGYEGSGIDIKTIINSIKQTEPYVYHQLIAQVAFGLRTKEALLLRPYINIIENTVQITDGSKGGKPRVIPIENEYQEQVVQELRQFVGKTASTLMDAKITLPQNYTKFYNVCKKLGLTKKALGKTPHAGRADYAMNFMLSAGLTPLVKGGEVGQLPKEQEIEIRLATSSRLGHNRVGITTAYSGPFTEAGKKRIEKMKVKKE